MLGEEPCEKCMLCRKICPGGAFAGSREERFGRMDKLACLRTSRRLRKAFRNPCGACIKVCPVGRDRELFRSTDPGKYFRSDGYEAERAAWAHLRRYGGYPLEGEEGFDGPESDPRDRSEFHVPGPRPRGGRPPHG